MTKKTTQQVTIKRKIPNPTGKGGFQDHPECRSPGGWRKENSISYQYNRFKNMTPAQIEKWLKDWEKPESKKDKINYSAAAWIAYRRVRQSMAENGLADAKEVADRTEGKSVQLIRHEVGDIEDARERLGRILGNAE